MAGQTRLDGSIQAGPPNASEGTFPASTLSIPLALKPNPKPWQVAEPTLTRRVNVTAPNWQALSGIGAEETVTEANLIYLRSDSPLSLRITQTIGGVSVVSTIKPAGLVIIEYPDSEPVTLVEVQGSATIDFYVQGQR